MKTLVTGMRLTFGGLGILLLPLALSALILGYLVEGLKHAGMFTAAQFHLMTCDHRHEEWGHVDCIEHSLIAAIGADYIDPPD